jgi:pyruvate/2-oxoglutarate dehydrogenase complex dihydrolipoamide dehydrogenase (E3) component
MVIGGGPAGMEAAKTAASRGHEVSLYDLNNELGGQLILAGIPPFKDRIQKLNRYLSAQVNKAGVQVKLSTMVTVEIVQEIRPDIVVLATGIKPYTPKIQGVDQNFVVHASDALTGEAEIGEVVIVMGGELVGCETADFLSEQGRKVTILRRGPKMAARLMPMIRYPLLDRLETKGVKFMTGVSYRSITNNGLMITDHYGKEQNIAADTIVLATGAEVNNELSTILSNMAIEIHKVGDCVKPRGIIEAIEEGRRIGMVI